MLNPFRGTNSSGNFGPSVFQAPFRGRHQFMIKGSHKIRIPNPHYTDIDASLLKEILRQTGISSTEWEEV